MKVQTMGKWVLAVLSDVMWINKNLAMASCIMCHPDICFIIESCWSGHDYFLIGRFLHWTAIIWVTYMSFIGWYINYWDLTEKSWLTWQVHTWLRPFWQQHDTPFPPSHAVTSMPDSEIAHHTSQHLYAQPHPRSIQYHSLLDKSLIIFHPKEIPHCCLVIGGCVQWCLFWFIRSGTPPITPPMARQWNFYKNLFFFSLLIVWCWLILIQTHLFFPVFDHFISNTLLGMQNLSKIMVLLKHGSLLLLCVFVFVVFLFVCIEFCSCSFCLLKSTNRINLVWKEL